MRIAEKIRKSGESSEVMGSVLPDIEYEEGKSGIGSG